MKNVVGEGYFHYRNWVDPDNTDELYILCGLKSKSDKLEYCRKFHLMKINKAIEIVKDVEIALAYPQEIICPRYIDDKSDTRLNILKNNIVLVFAPKNEGSKVSDPNKTKCTYLLLDDNLTLVDRIEFDNPSSFWSIEDYVFQDETNAVYLFGASMDSKDKYYDDLKKTKKFDGSEVMKVAEHKIAWVYDYSVSDLENKVVKSPSTKKTEPYQGKKFMIASYLLTNNGSLFIAGQAYFTDAVGTMGNIMGSSSTSLPGQERKIKYGDCFGIAIDTEGKVIGQYLNDMRGFGVFFPTDLNNYTKDFWNALIDQYYASHNYPGSDKVIHIVIGFDYNLKAVLRIINIFQLEGYWENYYAIGLQIQSSLYQYGYETQTMQLDAKYQFIPTYQARGGNFLLTPGARRGSAFFTIGGGMAKYTGSLKYHDEGTSIVNGVKTTFDNTTIYTGATFGYTATLGVTYVPWKYLELESFITGRLAKTQEIRDENGIILKNPYRNNEVVSLDFSGIDLRLGVKFIIP